MTDRLGDLSNHGVAVWLDDLSRERLAGGAAGSLDTLIERDHVVGVTTNPSIFASALAKGSAYDAELGELASSGADVDAAVIAVTTADVRAACDAFADVFAATGGQDGRVSIEVDPRLARDTDATIEQARLLWETVDRPNLLVKIPATAEGLPAITRAIGEGISVNVTLIFSLDRYRAVAGAYLDGLELALRAGLDLSTISSVASFFVSRVDAAIDPRLDELGTEEAAALRGTVAVANARLAFQAYEEIFSTPRWEDLAAAGARPQRPLWASVGVKDPAYADTKYVDELVTGGTVSTMPEPTLRAVAEHGEITGDTVRGSYADARGVLERLERLGIRYSDVMEALEAEGVEKFESAWSDLNARVAEIMGAQAPGTSSEEADK
ncbi:transaldolase [Georgenia sp. MJ206]|uniref:transaldolase n=1 Tax=Georgenia wangjunii TaxID=3117730 RepID=UPI002F26D3A8